jgi:hypothetical protein
VAAISKAPLYPWRHMAPIHLGLSTRVRTTRAASSASDRTLGEAGSAESPNQALGASPPRSERMVAIIPPWSWR